MNCREVASESENRDFCLDDFIAIVNSNDLSVYATPRGSLPTGGNGTGTDLPIVVVVIEHSFVVG